MLKPTADWEVGYFALDRDVAMKNCQKSSSAKQVFPVLWWFSGGRSWRPSTRATRLRWNWEPSLEASNRTALKMTIDELYSVNQHCIVLIVTYYKVIWWYDSGFILFWTSELVAIHPKRFKYIYIHIHTYPGLTGSTDQTRNVPDRNWCCWQPRQERKKG